MSPATTYKAVRLNQIAVIEQLSLPIYSGKKLTAYNGQNFSTWAETNTRSCLRRFIIKAVSREPDPGMISDALIRPVIDSSTLTVAYPLNLSGYGNNQVYDLEDMIFSDAEQIRGAIGPTSNGNYVEGQSITDASDFSIQEIEGVKLLVFDLSTRLYVSARGGAVVQSSTGQSFQYPVTTSTDSYVVTMPYLMIDTSYVVSVIIATLPGGGGIPQFIALEAGRTNYSFTLESSGDLPIGTVLDITVRDA